MAGSTRLVDQVARRIDDALDAHETALAAISPDLAPLIAQTRGLLAGGKRFRALFCYWGWRSVAGIAASDGPMPELDIPEIDAELPAVVSVAAALEFFHAAALVHDDIIDRSDTRRGRPAAHRAFADLHREHEWDGDADHYGTSAAILLGDLLLSWSDELFEQGLALIDRDAASAARTEYSRMRTEVTVGQYLDVFEEDSWRSRPDSEALPRAHKVIVYKSAKYSIEAPLRIGAAMAGGSLAQLAALSDFGLPLGIAFQLRDDMLGVFGDPAVTGKPSGDDLREGKRTVLIGLARQKLPATAVRVLDELLGDPQLDDAQVRMLQNTMTDSGAAAQVERIIAHNARVALEALSSAPLAPSAKSALTELAERVIRREA